MRVSTRSSLCTLFAVSFLATLLTAQDEKKLTTVDDNVDKQPGEAITMDQLLGTPAERFARGWQYKYQYVEQPSRVSIGSGSGQMIIPNPEHGLNQHSFTFDFSQVFPTSKQFAQAIQRYKSLRSDATWVHPCAFTDVPCTLEAGSVWKRALSGLSATASASEHGAIAQGVRVSPGYLFAGEVNFDPKLMLISGTDWKDVISTLKDGANYFAWDGRCAQDTKRVAGSAALDKKQKEQILQEAVIDCYRNLTRASHRAFYALIPSIQYKRQTPFDFLKYGGGIIPSSTESGLNTWTMTVDVRRLIAGFSPRLDAFEAASTVVSTKKPGSADELKAKLCIAKSDQWRTKTLINVDDKVSASACKTLANNLGAKEYQLGCASDSKAEFGDSKPVDGGENASPPGSNSCQWK